ncbi:DUF927 domain-containing protein [Alishewanella longhuensis]
MHRQSGTIVCCFSTAFVAPLLEPLGAEGFGFHYQGKSSSGKSAAAYVGFVSLRQRQ